MTTPYERFKALANARDVLVAIQADRRLSPMLRSRADSVLPGYPEDRYFERLVNDNEIGLPQEVAASLSECSSLLHAVAAELRSRSSSELSKNLDRVMRHLPDVGEIDHLRTLRLRANLVAHYAGGISAWIATQDPASAGVRRIVPEISSMSPDMTIDGSGGS
ncbi:BPSL0761 family protein [Pseudorhodoferax sp. Leaf274]|uniref:BPSL0761 family protein n=1 Tax=Pseudorhodoferax sp. Leaf274 TaxID=1736318 RepID=UPI0012E23FC9|nr:BPSL0761 family protein [Pseudorhodoferax sp. Leaf274]